MNKYEVVSGCYVPVGNGFRYKLSGQIVTLSDGQAAALAENIKPVDPSKGVAKRNTQPEVEHPVGPDWFQFDRAVRTDALEESDFREEVASGDGDPQADHE